MSDEDERQIKSKPNSFEESNTRRLTIIKSKLQEFTRDKTKYNVEKLNHDLEFCQSEMGHLSHAIADLNREIIHQISVKKNLNAKMAILRSNSGHHYPSLEIAQRDKERYEEELKKPNKSESYRELARQQIKAICEAIPQLQTQDEYSKKLQQAEEAQILAQKKREKFQENLNTKSRKQTELKQLLNDSATRLPELENAIEDLRIERDEILSTMNEKKQRRQTSLIESKSFDSPRQSFATLQQDTLQYEKQHTIEQLEKLRLLLNYFREKLTTDQHCSSLISPDDESILSSYPLDEDKQFRSPQDSIEYKKELPADIRDKYAGISTRKQSGNYPKKNRRKLKNSNIKHSPQMIVLYDDVRTSSGNSDTLPVMPLYEFEFPTIIKSLEMIEESLQSYLNDLSKYEEQDRHDDEIQDSALDTFSEASSLIESNDICQDSIRILPQLVNIPEARSSSSSDDKKTIVSSSSPTSSHHGHSKLVEQQQSSAIGPLTTVEELPPLSVQIAQIDRQISDEGYRSVRNEQRQIPSPHLTRSQSYDCTEKVGQWLSTTDDKFQSTPIDHDRDE